MSLSKEAIIRVEELSAAGSDLPDTDFKKVALPSGVQIQDLEKYQEKRDYFRGTYVTSSIESFLEYMDDQADDYIMDCFVNEKTMSAVTIFNLGTKNNPGHADYKAVLELIKTRPYLNLRESDTRPMTQLNMIEWFEDWMHLLSAEDSDGKPIEIKKALAAIRRIEIDESKKSEHETQQFVGKKSLMESIAVKGADESLPAFITYKTEPYLGFNERTFKLRVTIITARGELAIKLSIVQLEKQLDEIAEEFKKKIEESKNDQTGVFLGTFKA